MKIKKKTRLSCYVSENIGEWLRKYAFKTRQSQGAVVRQALKNFKQGKG